MAYDKRPRNAALYRVHGGKVARVADGLTICNGPAFDEPQDACTSPTLPSFVVDVFDLDPATGTLTGRRRFLDFSDAQVWPDGMTVDDEGMLWVALGRAGAVHRYRADGTLDGVVELRRPTPRRWPSAASTAATCTSRPHGSTSKQTAAQPSRWPA